MSAFGACVDACEEDLRVRRGWGLRWGELGSWRGVVYGRAEVWFVCMILSWRLM